MLGRTQWVLKRLHEDLFIYLSTSSLSCRKYKFLGKLESCDCLFPSKVPIRIRASHESTFYYISTCSPTPRPVDILLFCFFLLPGDPSDPPTLALPDTRLPQGQPLSINHTCSQQETPSILLAQNSPFMSLQLFSWVGKDLPCFPFFFFFPTERRKQFSLIFQKQKQDIDTCQVSWIFCGILSVWLPYFSLTKSNVDLGTHFFLFS